MRIYLAARYSRRDELCGYAEQLRALGHTITSRWLVGNHQVSDAFLGEEGSTEECERFALEDWHDLMAADCCVSFTEQPRVANSRGGRHVEFGAALAARKLCFVCGPRENVFHCLPEVLWFADWPGAYTWFCYPDHPAAIAAVNARPSRPGFGVTQPPASPRGCLDGGGRTLRR